MRKFEYSDWITDERLLKLNKKDRDDLLSYKKVRGRITVKKRKIERQKNNLKLEKELLTDLEDDLRSLYGDVGGLFDNLYFSVSLIGNKYRYIKRKTKPVRIKGTTKPFQLTDKVLKKHPTYFLSVTLKKPRPPKNIYLGNEMKIRNHLSKYYKDDKWLKNTTNWKRELLNTSHKGNDRHDILFDLIQKSPSNFRKIKITLDTLYPL